MRKHRVFLLGMLAVLLTFALVLAGCKESSGSGGSDPVAPNFNGTWTNSNYSIEVSGTSYTLKQSGTNLSKGTFTTTGTTSGDVTFNVTNVWVSGSWTPYTDTDSGTWSLSGNSLTINGLIGTGMTTLNGTWTKQ